MANETKPTEVKPGLSAWTAVKLWITAYRFELVLFLVSYAILAGFSGQRFLRQSAAPHFVYQAKGWLDGRLDMDFDTIYSGLGRNTPQRPILEDWACIRLSPDGRKVRCEGDIQPTDKWYSSFPGFPALLMLPFVAVNGYQLNDTSFGVFIGALAVALFYALLRHLQVQAETMRTRNENVALALLLAFGTLFFYCAIRGEVWFSAEVMGVALTCLYVRNSVGAKRPVLAGLFYSMAVLTRTPLVFAGLFFVLECLAPGPTGRLAQLKTLAGPEGRERLRRLLQFAAGAAPLALLAALYNFVRFGSPGEFGHRFFYWNRVNGEIDRFGLFSPQYLERNLNAAIWNLPQVSWQPFRLGFDPHGMSLLLTLPLLLLLFVPAVGEKRPAGFWNRWLTGTVGGLALLWACRRLMASASVASTLQSWGPEYAWLRAGVVFLVLLALVGFWVWSANTGKRLYWPLWLTVGVTALPGLFYQNDGYMQFGFRFSLDYTPYLVLLLAIGGWAMKSRTFLSVAAASVLVSFWGAVAFHGYTELVRNW